MNRIEKLRKSLSDQGLDGIFLLNDSNSRYMSGFTGSDSYVLISAKGCTFITDSRYTEQAQSECEGFEVIRWRAPAPELHEVINAVCERFGVRRLAFEQDKITYGMHEHLSKSLPSIELVPTTKLVEDIRCIKEAGEVECIRRAAQIADEAFEAILGYIRPGVSEKDIERELQYFIKKKGADDVGFSTIVASGKLSSLPHAVPSDKIVENGDFVTLDFGAKYKGYRSDMTRTIVVGKASDKQKEIYGIVKAAQAAAENAVKAGVVGNIPDNCARGLISEAGYGDRFGHGLGHGLGLDIHEEPFMSPKCERVLAEGNVITVEPGIYLPDWGGVRIEDTVLVTENGIEILTKSSKELIELNA